MSKSHRTLDPCRDTRAKRSFLNAALWLCVSILCALCAIGYDSLHMERESAVFAVFAAAGAWLFLSYASAGLLARRGLTHDDIDARLDRARRWW